MPRTPGCVLRLPRLLGPARTGDPRHTGSTRPSISPTCCSSRPRSRSCPARRSGWEAVPVCRSPSATTISARASAASSTSCRERADGHALRRMAVADHGRVARQWRGRDRRVLRRRRRRLVGRGPARRGRPHRADAPVAGRRSPRSRRPTPTSERSSTSTAAGSWWVQNGVAYYVDVSDQRLRRAGARRGSDVPHPRARDRRGVCGTPTSGSSPARPVGVVAVRETHHPDTRADQRPRRDPHRRIDGDPRALVGDRLRVVAPGSRQTARAWRGSRGITRTCRGTRPACTSPLYADGAIGDVALEVGNGAEAWVEPGWAPDGGCSPAPTATSGGTSCRSKATATLEPVVSGPFEVPTPSWVFGMQRWAVTDEHTSSPPSASPPATS